MTCMFSVRARGWVELSSCYCSCFCRNTSEPWFLWGLFQQSRSEWVLPHQWRDSKTQSHLQYPSTSTWMIIYHTYITSEIHIPYLQITETHLYFKGEGVWTRILGSMVEWFKVFKAGFALTCALLGLEVKISFVCEGITVLYLCMRWFEYLKPVR